MYILGLHGGNFRTHDASACLISDGKIVAFAEEERFIRQKRAFDKAPINAAMYCLDSAGIDISDVKTVAIGMGGEDSKLDLKKIVDELLPKNVFKGSHNYKVRSFNHHLCHAAGSFYCSKYGDSAILVVDGEGNKIATSIYKGSPTGLKLLKSFPVNQSLGYLYASFAKFLGFGSFGAGKLMGLSSYGKPIYINEVNKVYKKMKSFTNQGDGDSQDYYFAHSLPMIESLGFSSPENSVSFDKLAASCVTEPILTKAHKDLAASVQKYLEQKMLELAQLSINLANDNHLCISGGVALNCVANSKIETILKPDGFFIQPACEDSGISLGAALLSFGKPIGYNGPYLGVDWDDRQILKVINKFKLQFVSVDNPAKVGADLISKNKIVGWLQGRMETGPRALGSRSILADPRNPVVKDKVNNCKNREKWRPFGPSVLEEDANEIFLNYQNSPYMLKSFTVKKKWREKIPAVTHIDGTSRPQGVEKKQNPQYHELITNFKRITGIPMILNTSFNYAGEPIVCSPADAIRTFYSTSLDALIIGNYLLTKRE